MRKLGLIIVAAFSCSSSFSQGDFVRGYLISKNEDTLRGEVRYHPKKEIENYGKITFKDAVGGQKTYKPDQIKGYGGGGKHFISDKFNGEITFYRVHAVGKILLLEIMYDNYAPNEAPYKSEYFFSVRGDKEYTKLKENKAKKQMKEFMKDNPEFIKDLDDEKFDIDVLSKKVRQYDEWERSKK